MIRNILSFLRGFRRSERGAVAYLAVMAAVPLTLMLFYTVNSAKGIHDSTRAQDAADMVAMAHAAETARSLNTISMNQVTMTQVWATGINAEKYHNTLVIHGVVLAGAIAEAGIYGAKTCKKYKSIPKIGPALMAICLVPSVQYAAQLGVMVARTAAIGVEMKAIDAFRISERAIDALNAGNKDIYDRFPGAIAVQAEHIAREANVQSLYFDNYCESNTAATCQTNNSNKMKGMELPVTKNQPLAAYTTFCAGLHFGTGGASLGSIPGLGALGSLSIPLMNGSYAQRGFDMNKGPMYGGGDNDRYLPVHISKNFKIGDLLRDYWKLAERPRMFDGLLNLHMLGTNMAEVTADLTAAALKDIADALNPFGGSGGNLSGKTSDMVSDMTDAVTSITDNLIIGGKSTKNYNLGPGFQYPFEQKEDDNIFTKQVQLATLNMCAGNPLGALPGIDEFLNLLSGIGVLLKTPDPDLYHPKLKSGGLGAFIPTILPDVEDFDDDYKPLAFTYRQANKRWGPGNVFQDPNDGFVAYAQAITFNPDEIGLYSQNWQARLIPATKMEEHDQVRQRMQGKRPQPFEDLEQDLQKIPNDGTWSTVVVK